jgi:hypothetical protein
LALAGAFWLAIAQASNSSTDQGGGKRRAVKQNYLIEIKVTD